MVVEVLVTILVGGVGVVGGGTALVVRRIHRANRLVAERPSPAPTMWLWSVRRSAVLHRRLRGICQLARQVSGPSRPVPRRWRRRSGRAPSPLSRVGQELVDQALTLDARLVAADRLSGAWKRRAIAGLASEVDGLEASAMRLRGLAVAWQDHLDASATLPPPGLEDQLDAVEAALGELNAGA